MQVREDGDPMATCTGVLVAVEFHFEEDDAYYPQTINDK